MKNAPSDLNPHVAAAVAAVARACSLVVIAIAGVVLLGWILGQPALVQLGMPRAMAPNAAIGLLAAGISLWLLLEPSVARTLAARIVGLVPLLIGSLTLVEYVGGLDLHIDQLFLGDSIGLVQTGYPGRMAPLAALTLALAGTALLMLDRNWDRRHEIALWLSVPQFVLGVFALFGLGYSATRLAAVSGTGGIALHTVVAMLAVAIGLSCARPGRGPAAILSAAGDGGLLARFILPLAALFPPALGWLLLLGVEQGIYGIEGFAALTATVTFLILAGLSGGLAHAVERRHVERVAATERIRRSESLLNLAQEVSHVGGWEIDVASGRIAWTQEVYRIHEVPPSHDPNDLKSNLTFYTPGDREHLGAAIAAACKNGEPWNLESNFVTAKGNRRVVSTSGRAERVDGRIARIYGHIVDITDRKRAELALGELNATLEQRVRERTEDLQATNRELEAFAYSVSHDLRAPLRTIDGFSKILEEDYGSKVDAEGRDSLHRVRAAAQKMGTLIDDLLKLSRLSRSEMNRETVDLSALARSVAEELKAAEPARKVACAIAPGLVARGDGKLLKVVLDNLLGNAWKFTGKHATARIEVGITSNDGQPALFVRDDGAGFDMGHVRNLFAPFQRLHNTAEFPGTGIGLATVRRIVQRHGGRAWAEGAIEKGATFYFTLGADGLEAIKPAERRVAAAA